MKLTDFAGETLMERPGIFGLAAGKLGGMAAGAVKGAFNAGSEYYNNLDSTHAKQSKTANANWIKEITRQWISYAHAQQTAPSPKELATFAWVRYHVKLTLEDMGIKPEAAAAETPPVSEEEQIEKTLAQAEAVLKDPNASAEQKTQARQAKTDATRRAFELKSKGTAESAKRHDASVLAEFQWRSPENTAGIGKSKMEQNAIAAIARMVLKDPLVLDASKRFAPGTAKFDQFLQYLRGRDGKGGGMGGGIGGGMGGGGMGGGMGGGAATEDYWKKIETYMRSMRADEKAFSDMVQQARAHPDPNAITQIVMRKTSCSEQVAKLLAAFIYAYVQVKQW